MTTRQTETIEWIPRMLAAPMTPYFDQSEIIHAWLLWMEPILDYNRKRLLKGPPCHTAFGLMWPFQNIISTDFPFNETPPENQEYFRHSRWEQSPNPSATSTTKWDKVKSSTTASTAIQRNSLPSSSNKTLSINLKAEEKLAEKP